MSEEKKMTTRLLTFALRVQEEYDRYTSAKFKEFKRVVRILIARDQVSKEAMGAVIRTINGDVFACRASAWGKERDKLLRCIKDKEDTESAIEAEVSFAIAYIELKRACRCVLTWNVTAGNDVSVPAQGQTLQTGLRSFVMHGMCRQGRNLSVLPNEVRSKFDIRS